MGKIDIQILGLELDCSKHEADGTIRSFGQPARPACSTGMFLEANNETWCTQENTWHSKCCVWDAPKKLCLPKNSVSKAVLKLHRNMGAGGYDIVIRVCNTDMKTNQRRCCGTSLGDMDSGGSNVGRPTKDDCAWVSLSKDDTIKKVRLYLPKYMQ